MADEIFGPYPNNDYPRNDVYRADRTLDLGPEPVTLSEAKAQCRVTFDDDDAEIAKLIKKARKHVENYCNISIVYQQITSIVSYSCAWPLPYGPVIEVEQVSDSQSNTGSGPVSYTTSDDSWTIDGDEFNPRSCGKQRIVYTAGMSECPEDLKDVILQAVSFLYDNRGATTGVTGLQDILSNADAYKKMLWI